MYTHNRCRVYVYMYIRVFDKRTWSMNNFFRQLKTICHRCANRITLGSRAKRDARWRRRTLPHVSDDDKFIFSTTTTTALCTIPRGFLIRIALYCPIKRHSKQTTTIYIMRLHPPHNCIIYVIKLLWFCDSGDGGGKVNFSTKKKTVTLTFACRPLIDVKYMVGSRGTR